MILRALQPLWTFSKPYALKSMSPLNSPPSRQQPADVALPADWGMPRCPPNFGASEKAALTRPSGLAFRQQDNADNGQISFSLKLQSRARERWADGGQDSLSFSLALSLSLSLS